MSNHEQHSGSEADAPTPEVAELEYLWKEYSYRHDLCWRTVYKVVAAVVLLAVLPYIRDELTEVLGRWMLIPPGLGVGLAAFGICVLNHELAIFARLKLAYRTLQNAFFGQKITNHDYRKFVMHSTTDKNAKRSIFAWCVRIFMAILLLLSVGNVLFLWLRWIPPVC